MPAHQPLIFVISSNARAHSYSSSPFLSPLCQNRDTPGPLISSALLLNPSGSALSVSPDRLSPWQFHVCAPFLLLHVLASARMIFHFLHWRGIEPSPQGSDNLQQKSRNRSAVRSFRNLSVSANCSLRCSAEFRQRTVTVPSFSDVPSIVKQNGIPSSSARRYRLPIDAEEKSHKTLNPFSRSHWQRLRACAVNVGMFVTTGKTAAWKGANAG